MTTVGSLFSGYGGLDLAVENVFAARTVWHAEIDNAPAKILAAHWDVPNLGDVTAIDWAGVEPVDVMTGGFPCQDMSHAGKRAGLQRGENRSGLWQEFARAIAELRAALVVIENVRGLLSARTDSDVEPCPWCMGDIDPELVVRALGIVLADLADLGYDARWCGLRAADAGAPHGRYRVFIVATDTRGEAVRLGTGLRASEPRGIGRGRPDDDLAPPPTDGDGEGSQGREPAAGRHVPDGRSPADAKRGTVRLEPVTQPRRSSETEPRHAIQWGDYEPAIRRWERLTRPAPAPTEPNTKGGQRLSPAFVEWMMGLPAGWVTNIPGVSRNDQLKALGNGVVPQQAIAALRHLTTERAA